MDTDLPPDFSWVKARADCSIWKVFKELELGAQDDIETINSLRQPDDQYKFSLVKTAGKRFSVVLESHGLPLSSKSVDFTVSGQMIVVGSNGVTLLTASLTLNDVGQCRLKINNKELEQWQVRRLALEDLLFDADIHRAALP